MSDLDGVLADYHQALGAFVKGDSSPLRSLYSRRDDVTLANPFGPPRRGWSEVAETLAQAAAHYREGVVVAFEQVSRYVTPELAYIVELEQYRAKVGTSEDVTPVSVRVTTIFRCEAGTWKVVHRHADPITAARPAESVTQT